MALLSAILGCDVKVDTVATSIAVGSGGSDAPSEASGGVYVSSGGGSGTSGGSDAYGGYDAGIGDGTGGAATGGGPGTATTFGCADGYPRVSWPSASGESGVRCSASLARDRTSYALCSCGAIETTGRISTVGVDSQTGLAMKRSASVGSNGDFSSPRGLTIAGSLTIAEKSRQLISGLQVAGDLRVAGSLTSSGPVRIGGDGWLGGSFASLATATIAGDVHIAPMASIMGPVDIAGSLLRETISFSPPCRCDEPTDWLDALAAAATRNDNASIESIQTFLLSAASPTELELPCGVFFLPSITSQSDVRLTIAGRAALFVAGDVDVRGTLAIELLPGAELDWFIGGTLKSNASSAIGDPARASALRAYVAGAGPLELRGMAANLHAPNADVSLPMNSEIHGSIFARSVRGAGDITVHYDPAVVRADDACAARAAVACDDCGQCDGGLACVAGTCSPCLLDADCCAPLSCVDGQCTGASE